MTRLHLAKDYPKIPDWLGIGFVSLSVVIMCYSYLIPVIPILIYFGMWLPLALYNRTFVLKPSGDMVLTLAFPFLCFISFLWSDYMGRSLYTGVQFLVMATCLVIIARIVPYRTFLQGLAIGIMLTLLLSVFKGLLAYGGSILSHPLAGFFGSKNQLGFVSVMGILVALMLLFSDLDRFKKLMFGLAPLGVCLISLVLSHSATSIISILFSLGVISAAWVVTRFPMALRGVVIFLVFLFFATAAVSIMAFEFDLFGSILQAFGKDSTLTGRTYLWGEGVRLGMENPVLGYGYDSFWVPFNPPAERYWDEFDITTQSGFNFHNLYVEAFITLGSMGVIIVATVMLYLFLNSFYLIVRDGLNIYTSLFFGFSCLMLVRSISEVEFFGPFGLQALMIYSLVMRISQYKIARRISLLSSS